MACIEIKVRDNIFKMEDEYTSFIRSYDKEYEEQDKKQEDKSCTFLNNPIENNSITLIELIFFFLTIF